jgi:hypothetical protein
MKSATAFGSSLILSFMQLIPSIATKTIAANPGYAALSPLLPPAAVRLHSQHNHHYHPIHPVTTVLATIFSLTVALFHSSLIPFAAAILLHDSIRDTLDDAVPSLHESVEHLTT